MSEHTTRSGSSAALRKTLVRGILAVAVLGGGIASVHALELMLNGVFDKPPAPLSKQLWQMQTQLGTRYIADGPDEVLDPEMVESLGTQDYLVRRFQDLSQANARRINLNVNYYATGSSTPHVPEICWAGAGMEEAPGVSRRTFVVEGLQRKDGHGQLSDLTMRMISFLPQRGPRANEKGEPIYSNVAYVFQVNGMYVSNTQEVTSLFWKASYQYAYHAKIEVTPLDGDQGVLVCTQEEAQRIIADFMRAALPEVEACLPDPAILTPAGTNKQSTEQR